MEVRVWTGSATFSDSGGVTIGWHDGSSANEDGYNQSIRYLILPGTWRAGYHERSVNLCG